MLGGTSVAVSGYLLMFPFYGTTIAACSLRRWSTAPSPCCSSPSMIAHVYIGTIGMEGAFEAMGEGTVDLNWAKQHHSLWLEEERRASAPPAWSGSPRQRRQSESEVFRLSPSAQAWRPKSIRSPLLRNRAYGWFPCRVAKIDENPLRRRARRALIGCWISGNNFRKHRSPAPARTDAHFACSE